MKALTKRLIVDLFVEPKSGGGTTKTVFRRDVCPPPPLQIRSGATGHIVVSALGGVVSDNGTTVYDVENGKGKS